MDNGYQHLWRVGESAPVDGQAQITWLLDRRFYSVTTALPDDATVVFVEIGANDPNFNLRPEPAFIFRTGSPDGASFASVIEPHGEYNPTVEYVVGSHSNVRSITHVEAGAADLVVVETRDGQRVGLGIAGESAADAAHSVSFEGEEFAWSGPYKLFHSHIHIDGGR
ncbi:MAG: hypothetical protein D6773_19410 [Alphaproteobacteria bacterium]|nr:MAG: hypothetical protein D6773_19410 [Alphaproteobacteria bacterium]